MSRASATRISLSLSPEQAATVRRRARELGLPLWKYVARLAEDDASKARDELAAEGYRLLADDNLCFAQASGGSAGWPEWVP